VSGARAPILVAALVMVIWGASPALTKIAARTSRRSRWRCCGTLIAGVVAAPIVLLTRRGLPDGRRRRLLLLVSAVSGFVAFPLLFTVGQAAHLGDAREHDPRRAADLHRRYAAILDRRRPTRPGCSAAAWRWPARWRWSRSARTGRARDAATLGGDALVASSALVVAVGYVAGARLGQLGYHALAATYWGVAIGAVLMRRCSPGRRPRRPARRRLHAWGASLWMAVLTSIVGYVGWYWALARGGIQRIATIQFLQSILGPDPAAWLLGEEFHAAARVASIAILAGVRSPAATAANR
jgi:drug/metabolite transporter (DMT)-like permease